MRLFLAFAAIWLLTSCATSPQERLLGTWKSNKKLTIPTIHYKKEPPVNLREKLEDIFGKLEVTYTKNKLSIYAPDLGFKAGEWHYITRYKVLGNDSTSIVILAADPLTQECKITQIHFEGDNRYWIYIEGSGWKEYFDRIKKKTEQDAAANP